MSNNEWRETILGRLQRAGIDTEQLKNDPSAALNRLLHEVRTKLPPHDVEPISLPVGILIIEDSEEFRIEGGSAQVEPGGPEHPILMFSAPPYGRNHTLHIIFRSEDSFRNLGHAITNAAMTMMYPKKTSLLEEYLKSHRTQQD